MSADPEGNVGLAGSQYAPLSHALGAENGSGRGPPSPALPPAPLELAACVSPQPATSTAVKIRNLRIALTRLLRV
jgi:hypothetical protein